MFTRTNLIIYACTLELQYVYKNFVRLCQAVSLRLRVFAQVAVGPSHGMLGWLISRGSRLSHPPPRAYFDATVVAGLEFHSTSSGNSEMSLISQRGMGRGQAMPEKTHHIVLHLCFVPTLYLQYVLRSTMNLDSCFKICPGWKLLSHP